MRIARKLFVLAVMAFATMALGASSASAVTVTNEAAGTSCGTASLSGHIVNGGCRVRAASEVETQVQAFVSGVGFVTISTCEDVFEAAIGSDGTGYLYNATTSDHETGPQCTRVQCDEAGGSNPKIPWRLALESTSTMEITFCLRDETTAPGTAGTTCHTNIDVVTDGVHQYEFRATGASFASGLCENPPIAGGVRVIGHWNITPDANHPAIEIAG